VHGRLPVEWHEDRPVPVVAVNFNFEELDRLEAHALEAIEAGRFTEWVKSLVEGETAEVRREAVNMLVGQVIGLKKPAQGLIFIAIAVGNAAAIEKTDTEWAKILGVSKQDVQQGVRQARERLALRQNRTMRGPEARNKMRQGNFRPREKVIA